MPTRPCCSQVQFLSTSDNPTNYGANPTRDLVWSVSDGETPSVALTTVAIDARNDAPDADCGAHRGLHGECRADGDLAGRDPDRRRQHSI